jgi:large subunit ribosomal protein L15
MRLNELYPFEEERKNKKRVGRGQASGSGCTSGRGNKGAGQRAGVTTRPWFEGGQMPLQRRLPKRGFKNLFKVAYEPINLDKLMKHFEGATNITLEDIYARGLAKAAGLVKILGDGDITVAVTIEAHRFSASAAAKIAKAGGRAMALEAAASGPENVDNVEG